MKNILKNVSINTYLAGVNCRTALRIFPFVPGIDLKIVSNLYCKMIHIKTKDINKSKYWISF